MKIIWVAVGSLALVIGAAFLIFSYTSSIYNDLRDNLDRLEQAVEAGQWARAEVEAETLDALWHKADDIWTPIMDHREVNHLDESITRVKRLVELRSLEDLLLEITVSRRLMTRLKENEVPGIGNVF